MELKDRFDLATSGGPQHQPVADVLARGRAARRRRTTGLAALSTAAVLAVFPVASTVLDDDEPSSMTAAANPGPSPSPQDGYEWGEAELARMTMQGNVMVRPGATENERLHLHLSGRDAIALDLTWEGRRHYVLLYRTLSGFVSAMHAAAPQSPLAGWAAEAMPEGELPIALHNGVGVGADLPLVGYSDHQLYTVDGAQIVRVIEDPVEGWCEHAGWGSAAVQLLHEGTTYFAVLGDGNCGGSFARKGPATAESLEEAVAYFAETRVR